MRDEKKGNDHQSPYGTNFYR